MLSLGTAAAIAGCARATNLLDPTTPGFAGEYAPQLPDTGTISHIRIVTFNIKLARRPVWERIQERFAGVMRKQL